jgi:hypothetical protein
MIEFERANHDPLAGAPQWALDNIQQYRQGRCAVIDCHEQRSSDMACTKHEHAIEGEHLEMRMRQLGVFDNQRPQRRYY